MRTNFRVAYPSKSLHFFTVSLLVYLYFDQDIQPLKKITRRKNFHIQNPREEKTFCVRINLKFNDPFDAQRLLRILPCFPFVNRDKHQIQNLYVYSQKK